MTKYVALLGGGRREETIQVTQDAPGIYRVELAGKVHRVDVFRHDYGTISLIVDDEGKIQQRRLVLDRAIDDKWLVSSGLEPGDRVVVEGMQRVRPGTSVKVIPFEAARKAEAEPVPLHLRNAPTPLMKHMGYGAAFHDNLVEVEKVNR